MPPIWFYFPTWFFLTRQYLKYKGPAPSPKVAGVLH